jgi:hypothetical protein
MAAVTAAVIGAGTAIYASNQAKKQQKDAQKFANEQMGALDPFAEYRPEAAARLNALSKDPSSIKDSATYKARLMAAERTMAAQGYTGSGNALVAAADAGASAYQQEFDNLAMMSGAAQGQAARSSAYGTAAGANSNANDNRLSSIAGIGNNLTNLAGMFGGAYGGGGGSNVMTGGSGGFNKSVAPPPKTYVKG